jgi:hypothetical protein
MRPASNFAMRGHAANPAATAARVLWRFDISPATASNTSFGMHFAISSGVIRFLL